MAAAVAFAYGTHERAKRFAREGDERWRTLCAARRAAVPRLSERSAGAEEPRGGAGRGAQHDARLAPRRRRAGGRAGGDPRPFLPRAGGRDPAPALRRARGTRGPGRSSCSCMAAASCSATSTRTSPSAPRWRASSTCRCSRSTIGWRPSIPGRRESRIAIAAARWAAESPEALGRQVTGLVTCGDSAGGNFAIVVTLALRDEPAEVPVLAQWPIYPAADPGKGYPSIGGFRRRLSADQARAWTGSRIAMRPTRTTGAIRPAGEEPGRACRRPWWSPPASIRSATRAGPMPPPASRPACRPSSARPRAISTASSTCGTRSPPRPTT